MADGGERPAALRHLYLCLWCHLKLPAAVFNLAACEFEERAVVTQECRVFLAEILLGPGHCDFSNDGLAKKGCTPNYLGTIRLTEKLVETTGRWGCEGELWSCEVVCLIVISYFTVSSFLLLS